MKEFYFVLPDPKGTKLVWLNSIDFGGEPQEQELDKMQPVYAKLQYGILHKILQAMAKKSQQPKKVPQAPPSANRG